MAINEACQVWIEQRVQEELGDKNKTGKSLRMIGREISKEIEKIFEAKVKPGTIFQKARRIDVDTNVSPTENAEKSGDNGELEKLEKPVSHGGRREGSGRKPEKKAENTDLEKPGYDNNAKKYVQKAIADLVMIDEGHPDRDAAFDTVIQWIDRHRTVDTSKPDIFRGFNSVGYGFLKAARALAEEIRLENNHRRKTTKTAAKNCLAMLRIAVDDWKTYHD